MIVGGIYTNYFLYSFKKVIIKVFINVEVCIEYHKMFTVSKLLKPLWRPMKSMCYYYSNYKNFVTLLRNLPQTQVSCISNGLRVATEWRDVDFACIGLFFDAGSRYETMFENGIAHFFQHIVFKGTKSRSKELLEAHMTCTGAQFKAFTERELVGYYVECSLRHIPFIIDILSDCIFQNALNPSEIEMAKEIAYLEMMDHDEDANEILMDYLHGAAFHGTSLEQTVLGPSTNLQNFTDATIYRYLQQNFDPTRTVLVAVGGASHQCVHDLAEVYLNHMQPTKCVDHVYRFSGGDFRYRNDDLPFANVAIAFEAPNFCHSDAYVMDLATAFIGGWDASMPRGNLPTPLCARAAASGQADAYKGFYLKYKDTGLWGIQYTASRLLADELSYNFHQECMKLCLNITQVELERARNEYITSLLTELDTIPGTCKDIARWILFNGQRPTTLDRVCEYQMVSLNRMKKQCEELIYDRDPVVAAVGNIEVVPDYTRILASNYWLRV